MGSGRGSDEEEDALDEMSFHREKENAESNGNNNGKKKKKKKKKKVEKSGSAAPAPVIRNDEDDEENNYSSSNYNKDDTSDLYGEEMEGTADERSLLMPVVPTGDANLRPNTGIANKSRDYNLCNPPPVREVDLPKIVFRMRLLNMALCTAAISMESTSLATQILHPSKIVLGAYLCLFASIFCCYELHTPRIADIVADNFGFLQQPIGRAIFLILMATLAIAQGSLLLFILGAILLANAIFSIYFPCRYPEFKDVYQHYATEDAVAVATEKATQYAWANPGTVNSLFSTSSQ